jgi:hypothetical protein
VEGEGPEKKNGSSTAATSEKGLNEGEWGTGEKEGRVGIGRAYKRQATVQFCVARETGLGISDLFLIVIQKILLKNQKSDHGARKCDPSFDSTHE